ncbi:hypothetical protein MASR1M68_01610 [Elusimicrobiota bacterium]
MKVVLKYSRIKKSKYKLMKKFLLILFIVSFILQSENIIAINTKDSSGSHELYQSINLGTFGQQSAWLNLDSNIGYICPDTILYEEPLTNEIEISAESSYFELFNYNPNTNNKLLIPDNDNKIIIKSEAPILLQTQYSDSYGNDISNDYPKIYYRRKNTVDSFTELKMDNMTANMFSKILDVDYGEYEYYCTATNDNYPGVYQSLIQTFIVTERPHTFLNLNPNTQNDNANSNTTVSFSWTATKGVNTDTLSYIFCMGTNAEDMAETNLNIHNTCVINALQARTRYYWKVKVINQYGVELLNPEIFSFITLGEISRVYNAPNPFNPQKGENTRIFFEMPENGSAQLDIYSEYGDKIKTISLNNLLQGSNEIVYDGKDGNGRELYNGTYLCILKKKYSGQTKTEKCRLLIIK